MGCRWSFQVGSLQPAKVSRICNQIISSCFPDRGLLSVASYHETARGPPPQPRKAVMGFQLSFLDPLPGIVYSKWGVPAIRPMRWTILSQVFSIDIRALHWRLQHTANPQPSKKLRSSVLDLQAQVCNPNVHLMSPKRQTRGAQAKSGNASPR